MKKLIIGTLISVSTIGSAFAACTYNLDATPAEIYALPSTIPTAKFPTITNQKSSFLIPSFQSTSNTVQMYVGTSSAVAQSTAANNQNVISDKNIGVSGEYAFEFLIDNFINTPITTDGYISLGQSFILSDTNKTIKVGFVNLVNDPRNGINLIVSFSKNDGSGETSQSYPVSSIPASGLRVGLFINQNSKQIGLNLNGVNKGYIDSFSGTPSRIGYLTYGVAMGFKGSDPNIGKTISGELITDKSKIALTYAAGTKDICEIPL
ncbi:conserved exported hypothetical protein [Acinetobacter proteolyticus]|uniref:DUF4882 domain-containing protein n=1 Tax=Acinetobacter proteolyticus TaxID=1776741 RepID=A0A653K966_9GAMM|nr:DUF4882 family protein [Acinetobacter proteolyticus]VXA57510.1 conserved exported hypothetical protein [Acinetobacter proteolyticus]